MLYVCAYIRTLEVVYLVDCVWLSVQCVLNVGIWLRVPVILRSWNDDCVLWLKGLLANIDYISFFWPALYKQNSFHFYAHPPFVFSPPIPPSVSSLSALPSLPLSLPPSQTFLLCPPSLPSPLPHPSFFPAGLPIPEATRLLDKRPRPESGPVLHLGHNHPPSGPLLAVWIHLPHRIPHCSPSDCGQKEQCQSVKSFSRSLWMYAQKFFSNINLRSGTTLWKYFLKCAGTVFPTRIGRSANSSSCIFSCTLGPKSNFVGLFPCRSFYTCM